MPPIGTKKCAACLEFKVELCVSRGVCISCCGGLCSYGCAGCDKAVRRCTREQIDAACKKCGGHKEHCGCFDCGRCKERHEGSFQMIGCREPGKKPGICNYCHNVEFTACVSRHCARCKDIKPFEDCCKRCIDCCKAVNCPRKIRYAPMQIPSLPKMVCRYCATKIVWGLTCDTCGRKPTLDKSGGRIPSPLRSRTFNTNPLSRMVGVEIEVSDYRNGKKCSEIAYKWGAAIKSDGSVAQGFEINTAPANGDKFIEMIKDIADGIRANGATANWNAGLHVHVDMSDASWPDLRRLVVMYARTEDALFNIIDSRRTMNPDGDKNYCKKYGPGLELVGKTYDYKNLIVKSVFSGINKNGPGLSDRYMGLNLVPLWSYGSIEFRMHHGTTKSDKIIGWALLVAGLCDASTKVSDYEADNWPKGLPGLLKYAPTDDVKKWVQSRWEYFQGKREEIAAKKKAKKEKKGNEQPNGS